MGLYESTMEDLANRHLHEIELDVKNNPKFSEGAMVSCWGAMISATERAFEGYGIVRTRCWNVSLGSHFYDVEMLQTRQVHLFPDADLARAWFENHELAKVMRQWRYQVGEGSGHNLEIPNARLQKFQNYRRKGKS